jgi:hypothetical protein
MPIDLLTTIIAVALSFIVFGAALLGASYLDGKF